MAASLESAVESLSLRDTDVVSRTVCNYLPTVNIGNSLGFFCWLASPRINADPGGAQRATAMMLKSMVRVETPPLLESARVVVRDIKRRPVKFLPTTSHAKISNAFPYNYGRSVDMHVVKTLLRCDEEFDFSFGGSTLNMLATSTVESGDRYVVMKQHGTIFVMKHKRYDVDLMDIGHQFERLVCGRGLQFTDADYRSNYHAQSATVAGFRTLFIAEVDGYDKSEHSPVEMKTGNPRYLFQPKLALQMASSGSCALIQGVKSRDQKRLDDILCVSLRECFQRAGTKEEWRDFNRQLEENMGKLHAATTRIPEDVLFELQFRRGSLHLKDINRETDIKFLASSSVATQLLA